MTVTQQATVWCNSVFLQGTCKLKMPGHRYPVISLGAC